jgi:hypothetical protein
MLRRKAASDYLRARGFPVAGSTLAKLASIGGGPEFQRFGRVPLYAPEALDHWADARLSIAVASTSELGDHVGARDLLSAAASPPDGVSPTAPTALHVNTVSSKRAGE